ncbi:MAG: T9SS type A sorting domain-containing protein [Saprospiraceae bacterium]|nr:T9SS type A sorting domain-containing protein [Saprospiraceae bacterium]
MDIFVLRTPIANNSAVPSGPTPASFVAPLGLTSGLVFGGQTSSATHLYQIWINNDAFIAPNGGTGSNVVLISFDINHGANVGTVELADDSFSDILIDQALGGGTSGAVFGSDININNSPTVNSYFQPIINNFVFPISLSSFDVTKINAKNARLNWTTSSEKNSDYFGIERSEDGDNWESIGTVKAAGILNSDLAYQFIDKTLPLNRSKDQIFYYRLRLTDLDGDFKYSDTRGINFERATLDLISIYPNPTTDKVNVDLSSVELNSGPVSVLVYDMKGSLVLKRQVLGNGIELINIDQLPTDIYNFVVRQGEQIHQQKVIKID